MADPAHILVVDDEPQITRVLRTSLSAQGYDIRVANSGEMALEIMKDWRPNLIITDLCVFEVKEGGGLVLTEIHSNATVDDVEKIYEQSERLARASVTTIPDGTYTAESFMDDDGITFGKRIPKDQIWQLAAYVRSMSGLAPQDAAPNRDDAFLTRTPESFMDSQEPERAKPSSGSGQTPIAPGI